MTGIFSYKIEREDLIKRLKLKRLYPHNRLVDYRDKLIHPYQNDAIFNLAWSDFLSSEKKGTYQGLSKTQAIQRFIYLFDDHLRTLLQHSPESVQYWALEYLIYYFADLFHHPRVRQLLANEADRKSCFHDAVLQWLDLVRDPEYKLNRQVALRSVFYEIFYRRCVDFIRRAATKKNSPNQLWISAEASLLELLSDETQDMVEAASFQLDPAELKAAVAELGSTCLQLIQWFYFDACSLEEIGQRLQNSVSYVKTTKWRCIQRLKKMLESKMFDHE